MAKENKGNFGRGHRRPEHDDGLPKGHVADTAKVLQDMAYKLEHKFKQQTIPSGGVGEILEEDVHDLFLVAAEAWREKGFYDRGDIMEGEASKYLSRKRRERGGTTENLFTDEEYNPGRSYAFLSIAALGAALFFLSSNLTGFAVASSYSMSNGISLALFFAGLIFAFLYVRRRRYMKKGKY